jgi:hypothetical protein
VRNFFKDMRVYNTLLIGLVSVMTACNQDDVTIESKNYQKNVWEPAIDSLTGQYFEGIDIGWNGQLYANYWKGWNGLGPTLNPATIISDDGLNWRRVSKENPIDGTWTYLKRHKEIIFAGTPDKGLYFSKDNGIKWANNSTFNWQSPDIIRSNNDHLVIADSRAWKTYISENDGNSWRELFPKYMRVIDVQKDKISAMTTGIIIESIDWGNSWTYDSSLVVQEKEKLNSIGLGKVNGKVIAAVTKGLYVKSGDRSSWTNVTKSLTYGNINLLFVDNDKIIIQTYTDGKFYYSDNVGKTWAYFGQGLPVFTYQGIESTERSSNIVKTGGYLFITTADGFFKRRVE